MTLKGQNLRIYTYEGGDEYRVVAMSTNCTITLTGNSEDASHKDIVGMAAVPTIVSKGWSVSVESLDVTDVASMLAAIKSFTPFTLRWDESSTTDNQTEVGAAFAHTGQAYLNDVVFQWNDRTNSTKQLQFTGSGPLTKVTGTPVTEVIPASMAFTKGQFVRLFISNNNTDTPSRVVAAARQLSLHVSLSLETVTTKDTEGDWLVQEPTALNYDITSNALVRSGDTITSQVGAQTFAEIEEIFKAALSVQWMIANVSGANQRTKGATIVSGSVIVTSLVANGPNRQSADYTTTLTGVGDYVVAV